MSKLQIGAVEVSSGDAKTESRSDAAFAVDKYDRTSMSGCVMTTDGTLLSWSCKKLIGVSLSTMEVEYIAAS